MSMLWVAFGDHRSFEHVQSGKQGRGSMPLVVMRPTFGQAGPQRKNRLRAVQRLNLALFIDRSERSPSPAARLIDKLFAAQSPPKSDMLCVR